MRKLITTIWLCLTMATLFSQVPVNSSYWFMETASDGGGDIKISDSLYVGYTGTGNIFNFILDTTGHISKYGGAAPADDAILMGSGGRFVETMLLPVGALTGLNYQEVLFGKVDNTIDQHEFFKYDKTAFTLVIGDATGGDPTSGYFRVTNGTDGSSLNPGSVYIGSASLGEMYIDGKYLVYQDLGGDLFKISRTAWSTDMFLNFPSAKGVVNKKLEVGSVLGDDVNLLWVDLDATDITGLVPAEPLFGKSDGTIDQDPDWVWDEALNQMIFTNTPTLSLYDALSNYANEITSDKISISDAASITQIDLTPAYMRLSTGSLYTSITRQTGGSNYSINLPNANGINGQSLRLNVGLDLEWYTPLTLASLSATSPIGYNSGTGVFNLLGSAADRILYTTGVNTWAETVSTSFGRSLMDDANAAAGLATLGIPVDNSLILLGDGTGVVNSADLSYNTGTGILDINKFEVDGGNGWISSYEGATLTNGLFPIGRTSDGVLKLGTIISSDINVGYSDPNITLDYVAGSIVNADINGTAAIDATKIADGSVTSTEFQYINTLSSNAQTQLNAKAPLASPTFTGTVTIPTPFTLGATSVTTSGTELNYVDNVTSDIQTQLDSKLAIVGTPVHLTAKTASIGATTLYTTPADGFYTITVQLAVTTAGGTSIGTQIRFTNVADNVAKTMPSNNSNGLNQCASSTTANAVCYTINAYCKSGTNIQYITTVTGAAGVQYSVDAWVVDNQ